MRISWLDITQRLEHEFRQCEAEGIHVGTLRDEWLSSQNLGLSDDELRLRAEALYQKLEQRTPVVPDDPVEPSSWDRITRLCDVRMGRLAVLSPDLVEDRILGGWLGRAAGCLLGKPVEKIPRDGIRELLSSNGTWPIKEYITAEGIPETLRKRYPWNKHSGQESLRENILCMTEDDDMNYPMLNLSVYEKFGEGFTTEELAQAWLSIIPVLSTFTAERVAYVNLLAGIEPPRTATVRNPYREWIGAQIRADLWGWVSPGDPQRAAEYAWRDARLSHVRNGMYAEMFFAAAIAASFTHNTVTDIINEAIRYIPAQSRIAQAIRFVFSVPVNDMNWDETVDLLYEKFGEYHWVHSVNNSALVVAALLFGEGDYERSICSVVMGGWDTDSNGATVGSIIGTMLGAKELPPKWITPLNNRIRSSLKGFDNVMFTELAQRTAKLVATG